MRVMSALAVGIVFGIFLLLACGDSDEPTAIPTPDQAAFETRVARSVAETMTALPTATATQTPAGTSTTAPLPTATETPHPTLLVTPTVVPSATLEPTATASSSPSPTATPTAMATPTPMPPTLGATVDIPPLASWEPVTGARYIGFVAEDASYHLRINQLCSGVYVCGVTNRSLKDAGRIDLSAAVDVRLIAAEAPTSAGCVALGFEDGDRHFAEFWLCVTADAKTFAVYVDGNRDDPAPSSPSFLLPPKALPAVKPATSWNRLQIIIDGLTVWFLINDVVVERSHMVANASETPTIGIHIGNTGDPPVEFSFRSLEVRHTN
jgi:hypothetical protein